MLQLAIVDQTLLGEGEKATVFANGGLVKDWKKSQRLIVIVTNGENSHALIVYNVKTLPVTHSSDLSIDSVVAIDESFKYDYRLWYLSIYKSLSMFKFKLDKLNANRLQYSEY